MLCTSTRNWLVNRVIMCNTIKVWSDLGLRTKLRVCTGEDRWLSTLLLKQGYRIEYAAAADAETYAPEGFDEFFNQRRRWTPSSIANTLDLLADYKVCALN